LFPPVDLFQKGRSHARERTATPSRSADHAVTTGRGGRGTTLAAGSEPHLPVSDDRPTAPTSAERWPVDFPEVDAALYTVGQVAELLDVQPAFLRRLDSEHVVRPGRSAGGQRRYSRVEIDRIAAVAGLMNSGMTLASASRILDLEDQVSTLQRQLDDRADPPA
jgi:MerR family transcriptional regulator/heat shock protein HspR